MAVINALMKFILTILDRLLPALGVPDSFFNACDSAFSMFVNIVRTASFFVPLDIMVTCLVVMSIVDNFALISRIGQWTIKLIRG